MLRIRSVGLLLIAALAAAKQESTVRQFGGQGFGNGLGSQVGAGFGPGLGQGIGPGIGAGIGPGIGAGPGSALFPGQGQGGFGYGPPQQQQPGGGCPLCDSSVYSYCSHKMVHDACCCDFPASAPQLRPPQCSYYDCSLLYAKSCYEHSLIKNCCCNNPY